MQQPSSTGFLSRLKDAESHALYSLDNIAHDLGKKIALSIPTTGEVKSRAIGIGKMISDAFKPNIAQASTYKPFVPVGQETDEYKSQVPAFASKADADAYEKKYGLPAWYTITPKQEAATKENQKAYPQAAPLPDTDPAAGSHFTLLVKDTLGQQYVVDYRLPESYLSTGFIEPDEGDHYVKAANLSNYLPTHPQYVPYSRTTGGAVKTLEMIKKGLKPDEIKDIIREVETYSHGSGSRNITGVYLNLPPGTPYYTKWQQRQLDRSADPSELQKYFSGEYVLSGDPGFVGNIASMGTRPLYDNPATEGVPSNPYDSNSPKEQAYDPARMAFLIPPTASSTEAATATSSPYYDPKYAKQYKYFMDVAPTIPLSNQIDRYQYPQFP